MIGIVWIQRSNHIVDRNCIQPTELNRIGRSRTENRSESGVGSYRTSQLRRSIRKTAAVLLSRTVSEHGSDR